MKKISKKNKKFYIATAIAYVNSVPHIGHALEIIQADTIARHARLLYKNVFFNTGTDEHGDKISRSAKVHNKSNKLFVNEITSIFKSQKKAFNLSYDNFLRTTDKKKHWPGVYKLWDQLVKQGDIYKKEYEGLYCVGCEKFLMEKDLVDRVCSLHKKEPEKVSEENYFFKLSKYAKQIEKIISQDKIKILPESRKNEVLSFIKEGLEDISFSRSSQSVDWGIPIRHSDQTIYVWCDALSNYLTAVGYGVDNKKFNKYWPTDINLIGKDILRFHAIYWPAMLLSAKLSLPKSIMVHGFITSDGQKMSKTLGNVVDPFEVSNKYGSDVLRYYLLREIPSDGDGDFSWEKLKNRYNDDLAKGVGNFISRTANLLSGEKIKIKLSVSPLVKSEIKKMEISVQKNMNDFKIHDALASILHFIKFGDGYINKKQPWKNKNIQTSRDLAEIAINIGYFLTPFMPDTSNKIMKIFSIKDKYIISKKTKPLFPRID